MAGRTVRSLGLAGVAGVVVVGALVPLAAVVLAGGDGPLGWVVLGGAAACASGLALGATQRVLPALGLAVVAAAALAIAATARDEEPVRELAFPARGEVAGEQERSRANMVATEQRRSRGNVAETEQERSRGNAAETEQERSRGNAVMETARDRPPAERRRPSAARFVRDYYAEIEAGRYEEAWSRLSASTQGQSFEIWRAGYATTVSQRVEDVETEPGGVVRYVLVAVDRTPCGTTTERRFEIRWRLVRARRSFTATVLSGVKLAGVDPVAAC